MTVPYYAKNFPMILIMRRCYRSNNFDQNQKVELGTYTYKKNGAVYHSETVTDKYGHKSIYCYDNSGSLKLLVERTVDEKYRKGRRAYFRSKEHCVYGEPALSLR